MGIGIGIWLPVLCNGENILEETMLLRTDREMIVIPIAVVENRIKDIEGV